MTRKSLLSPQRSRNDLDLNVIVDNDVLTKKIKLSPLKVLLVYDFARFALKVLRVGREVRGPGEAA